MSEQDVRPENESLRMRNIEHVVECAAPLFRNAESRLIRLSASGLIGDDRRLLTEAGDATLDVPGASGNEIAGIAGAPV